MAGTVMNGPVPTMLDMLMEMALSRPNFLGRTTVTELAGSAEEVDICRGFENFNLNYFRSPQENS
jgi:hypothetical protein